MFKIQLKKLNNFINFTKRYSSESILPDNLFYNIPKYDKNPSNFDFPWLINGAPILEIKARFLPEQVFVRSKISKQELLKHLFKIYRGILLASSEYDYEFLEQYCEQTFYNNLKDRLDEFNIRKYQIELVEDTKANNGYRLLPEMHLYDCILIKGLQIERNKNETESKYSVCNDIDDMGFVSYIPKYISNPINFRKKEEAEEVLGIEFRKVIFRAYVMFKTGYKLFVYDRFGKKIFDYSPEYNNNHVCVFESLMLPPPQFKSFSKTETYTEWISKHTFSTWKMIDMDNWMKGNPYFNK